MSLSTVCHFAQFYHAEEGWSNLRIEKSALQEWRVSAIIGRYGGVDQLVEHCVRNAGVESSNLFVSTRTRSSAG